MGHKKEQCLPTTASSLPGERYPNATVPRTGKLGARFTRSLYGTAGGLRVVWLKLRLDPIRGAGFAKNGVEMDTEVHEGNGKVLQRYLYLHTSPNHDTLQSFKTSSREISP
jgi:hypothetical protein